MLNAESIADANEIDVTPVGLTSGKRFTDEAKATAAIIRVKSAIQRGVIADVMSAWTDALEAKGLTPSPLSIGIAWWSAMSDAVYAAIDSPDDVALWMAADEQVRGNARHAALLAEQEAHNLQGSDHWDDVEDTRRAEIALYQAKAARLRAFAKAAA